MRMHRSVALWILALTLLVGVSSSLLVRRLESQELKRASFTATKVENFYKPDGTYARTEEFIDAFRSDGSKVTVRRFVSPYAGQAESRLVVDVPARKQVAVNGLTESISTTHINDQQAHQLSHNHHASGCADLNPPPDMIGPKTGQRGTILGYQVILREAYLPDLDGKRPRMESWRAPALDCYPLKETVFVGEVATNVREVTSVTLGEPQTSQFQIPTGYTERSPSQVLEEFQRRYPARAKAVCPTCGPTLQMDNAYHRNRAPDSP